MIPFWPLPFLYAEIHYKIIPWFWSRIYKKEPEIIADTIWRVDPGITIPLLLLIKDAHLFPITLERIIVSIKYKDQERNVSYEFSEKIDSKLWWRIEYLEVEDHEWGQIVEINTEIRYKDNNNRKLRCINDNYYRHTPPFNVLLSRNRLPSLPGWKQGDLHLHSFYTSDQIEFAAPIKVNSAMSKTMGLDFIGVTDHSYDLDDSVDSYLINDPDMPHWKSYLNEVSENNKVKNNPLIIPGFEVSVANTSGNSVHLQVFNSEKLYEGTSDSGEKWLHAKPEWQLRGILTHLNPESLACAAHIGEKPPLMHRVILGRGHYRDSDLENENLKFFQIANGKGIDGLEIAKEKWIRQLLKGRRIVPLAGSDSHGNFNFSRSVVLPHLMLDISKKQLLGEVRTAIWSENSFDSHKDIIDALYKGCVQITSGPVISVMEKDGNLPVFGSELKKRSEYILIISGISTAEFGEFIEVKILGGDKTKGEYLISKIIFSKMIIKKEIKLTQLSENTIYFRFEAFTDKGYFAITSPVYIANFKDQ